MTLSPSLRGPGVRARATHKKDEEDKAMKRYQITYFLRPEAENIVFSILAKSYEDACIFAKDYREGAFDCREMPDETPEDGEEVQS